VKRPHPPPPPSRFHRLLWRRDCNGTHFRFSFKRGPSSAEGCGDGLEELSRVLAAYSVYNPDVGYCQGMNFVAALLLLTASEEDVFWMLVALVTDVLPARFYDRTMMGATVELELFGPPPPPSLPFQTPPRAFTNLSPY
jgi:hypothetical protein